MNRMMAIIERENAQVLSVADADDHADDADSAIADHGNAFAGKLWRAGRSCGLRSRPEAIKIREGFDRLL